VKAALESGDRYQNQGGSSRQKWASAVYTFAMPMCVYGQNLYDEWTKYGRIIKALVARRTMPMMANVASDVPFDLNYEEAVQKGIEAQQAFLGHQGFCSSCANSWGRSAGCDFKPPE
jgi:hypothetical protein